MLWKDPKYEQFEDIVSDLQLDILRPQVIAMSCLESVLENKKMF